MEKSWNRNMYTRVTSQTKPFVQIKCGVRFSQHVDSSALGMHVALAQSRPVKSFFSICVAAEQAFTSQGARSPRVDSPYHVPCMTTPQPITQPRKIMRLQPPHIMERPVVTSPPPLPRPTQQIRKEQAAMAKKSIQVMNNPFEWATSLLKQSPSPGQ